ncbi:hypothetical protein HGM15179_021237 [Zosterops borbonicus]|uniref:Uncharacterized protein n=1 Tax=Zosterops borbonicus TaxID=364589 RepID=A0A8K1D649_9PASS|nr:hypothetical protein HGM15179_021237 [Zosterops borbonicus]
MIRIRISQDAIGFLGHLGTVLAHVQPAFNQHLQVLFHQAVLQPLFLKPVALHGIVVTQWQDPALGLIGLHTVGPSLLIKLVQILLQSLPALQQINTLAQSGVICRLTEGAFVPLSKSSIKTCTSLLKQFMEHNLRTSGPNTESWGKALATSYQLNVTPFATTLLVQLFSQIFSSPRVHQSKPRTASSSRRML